MAGSLPMGVVRKSADVVEVLASGVGVERSRKREGEERKQRVKQSGEATAGIDVAVAAAAAVVAVGRWSGIVSRCLGMWIRKMGKRGDEDKV
jgi:hypothetical protein